MPIASPSHDSNISQSTRDFLERVRQELSKPRRPIYIPVTQFSGYLSNQFLGSGTPNLEQINLLGIVGTRIDATGDTCDHLFYVPKDFNVDTNIKFEVVWCTDNATASNTATWKIEYSAISEGETLSLASTALSSVITADNVVGAYKVAMAPYGFIARGILMHGDFLHLKVSLSAVSGLNLAVDKVYLLGILINDEG